MNAEWEFHAQNIQHSTVCLRLITTVRLQESMREEEYKRENDDI